MNVGTEAETRDWLVIARRLKTGRDYPTYTVRCEHPDSAIDCVLELGFCFALREWELRAVEVKLVARPARA